MEKKLQVKDLVISFRTQGGILKAVRNISFDLYKGETLAIVGESGSGKSVTSRAIIGILAGNAIVEGGEILYDIHDLLKIDEENFHKIRGDKISMIFQDPMSSLNPIMRVGQQITEAMILNGKARQRNAKQAFNRTLKLLNENMNLVMPENKADNDLMCKTFDSFCIVSTQLELLYNNAHNSAIALASELQNVAFLIEKKQPIEIQKTISLLNRMIIGSIHEYVLDEATGKDFVVTLKSFARTSKNNLNMEDFANALKSMIPVIEEASERRAPDFFRLGYYLLDNSKESLVGMSIDEINAFTLKYLDDYFMKHFIEVAAKAIAYSKNQSVDKKKAIVADKQKYLDVLTSDNLASNKKEAFKVAKELYKLVLDAIDRLEIIKRSDEYSFKTTILHDLNTYFNGIHDNPVAQANYEKQLAKYNALVEKGETPTWKVIPPRLVDLELAKANITKDVEKLFHSFGHRIKEVESFDFTQKAINMIDFFKEQASAVVYKITPELAKSRAIKLLEEVGISEPAIRYYQYPFEFSGGMRQRIVIAIALSANPDILICDEPTTALDVTIQSQILELINKIKVERNLSVIFITHDLGVVANMADRIAVMYAGKIVETGTADDIFYDPRHPYTWALLSSMPDLDTKEKLEAIPGTPPNMIFPPVGDAFADRNKYALEIDFEMQPPMFKVSDTHYAATWLLHPDAPKINPPKIVTDRIERMRSKEDN